MANQVISMQQIRSLIQLLEKGHSLRAIALQLSISRQSVTLYAIWLEKSGYPIDKLRHFSDADFRAVVYAPAVAVDFSDDLRRLDFIARTPYFLTELIRTCVTRLLLWEEYRKEYESPYSYTRFCDLLKEAIQPTKATMHLVHTPAEMVMVDFTGDKMSYVHKSTGEVIFALN